jgi:hypothetical protein
MARLLTWTWTYVEDVVRSCLIKHVLAVLIACPFHQKTPARLSSGSPVCTAWIGSIVLFLPAAFFGG